jgi:xylulokinase
MPSPTFVLGCDLSRSGLGLAILAGDGSVVHSLHRAYAGESGDSTQIGDPLDWWRATRTGIKELLRRAKLKPDQIRCIGLTGDDGCVLIDRDGNSLVPATLGPDPRAAPAIDELLRAVGARTLLNLTGGSASTSATATKLLALRSLEKRAWHDLHQVLGAKDFLRFKLTGTLVTDATDAAATLLFNPKTRTWSKQLLTLLGFQPEWLPPVADGKTLSGRVTEAAARDTGLAAGTPVVTGAGHPAALALACGAITAGAAVIELGGRGDLFLTSAEAVRDPLGRLSASCHTVAGIWALSAKDLAGATGLDWLLDSVMPAETAQARRNQRDPLELVAELAAEIPPGADDLIFLPATQGATGGFLGIDARHGRGHLARAVLEGGALAVRRTLEHLAELKRAPDRILVTGPGAGNHLWCQILADVLDRQVIAHSPVESAAIGSAILATVAVGVHKTLDDACAKVIKQRHVFNPRKAAADAYIAVAPRAARLNAAINPGHLPATAAGAPALLAADAVEG